jgi:predicted metal-dependent phosphoesterase TrpH
MFAEVLLKKPEYRDHPLLRNYRPGGSRSDNPYVNFYWDFYSQGKPCYVKIDYPPIRKIVDLIHQNHGIAVLAHPGVNLNGKESMLPSIAALGVDGIEAFSSYHTQEQAEYYYRQAIEMGKLVTCGSDFHGKIKPAIRIGGVNYPPGFDRSKMDNVLRKTLEL